MWCKLDRSRFDFDWGFTFQIDFSKFNTEAVKRAEEFDLIVCYGIGKTLATSVNFNSLKYGVEYWVP